MITIRADMPMSPDKRFMLSFFSCKSNAKARNIIEITASEARPKIPYVEYAQAANKTNAIINKDNDSSGKNQ